MRIPRWHLLLCRVYEAEEKNFVEPDASDGRISYRAEQARLKKNLEAEKDQIMVLERSEPRSDLFFCQQAADATRGDRHDNRRGMDIVTFANIP